MKPILRQIPPLCAALMVLAHGALPAQTPTIQSLDLRIVTVGERLAESSAPLCSVTTARTGFAVHSLLQYGESDRAGLLARFPAPERPAALVVVPGSAADQAGLRPDDGLLAIDGDPLLPGAASSRPSFATTAAALDAIDRGMADGRAILTVERAGATLDLTLIGRTGCATHFLLLPSSRLDAQADGRFVQITSAQANLAIDDDELASSLAHELAHNILRHRERLNAAGVERGLAAHFGRNARLFRATEIEADRLSVYLMAMAGYDPDAALRFVDRLAAQADPLLPTTHPSWARRRALIRQEIDRINSLQAQGLPVRPGDDLSGTVSLDRAPA